MPTGARAKPGLNARTIGALEQEAFVQSRNEAQKSIIKVARQAFDSILKEKSSPETRPLRPMPMRLPRLWENGRIAGEI